MSQIFAISNISPMKSFVNALEDFRIAINTTYISSVIYIK